MIIVDLGKDVKVDQFNKYIFLYQKAIDRYKLYDYTTDIEYRLPKPITSLSFTPINKIRGRILDYARIARKVEHFSKAQQFAVSELNRIYNEISFNKFNYNLTKQDMITLNKIDKQLK